LDEQEVAYRPFYIVNMLQLSGDEALVLALAERPEVDRLMPNPRVNQRHSLAPDAYALPAQGATLPYGITATGAPEVWAQGFTGQGIVVASADTGVEWDHPALRAAYRGWNGQSADHAYSWHDAWAGDRLNVCEQAEIPCDDNGHGTHTVGTMIGQTADATYGMAPQAEWIACRNMRNNFGTPATYTACFEFFLAPYPQGGDPFTDGRPELAPHIINNSWGCIPSEGCDPNSLRQVVETVRAAGLMVVASAGNSGPSCSTVRDPIAIYDAAFSVGAHDAEGELAGFSSRGPVTVDGSKRPKPDLTAPGVGVLSAYPNATYTSLSGTSMAAPHVAGAAALLWSAAPYLMGNPDLTEQLLIKSADPVLSRACLAANAPVTPNPAYGYGRLDVAAALALARQTWHGVVEVTRPNGAPVNSALVSWQDVETGYSYTQTTAFTGIARLGPLLEGTYTLRVQTAAGGLSIPDLVIGGEVQTGEAANAQVAVRYRTEPGAAIPVPQLLFIPWVE
jgi:subtilisin family serine protease